MAGAIDGYRRDVPNQEQKHGYKASLHGQPARIDAGRRAVRPRLKPVVFVAAVAPLVSDAWAVYEHQASHAYRAVINDTGIWTMWFVAFTLALTPLRRFTSWTWLAAYRRMFGLFAFFYGSLHALTYLALDRAAALDASIDLLSRAAIREVIASTIDDIGGKPFLLIGVVAFVAMIPLAVTSPAAIARRLGGRRWRRLHKLVYVVAAAGLLHHWWPLRDRFSVDRYAFVMAVLFLSRLVWVRSASGNILASVLLRAGKTAGETELSGIVATAVHEGQHSA